MKLVINCRTAVSGREENYRIMEVVKDTGIVVSREEHQLNTNSNYIYIEHNKLIYKFNRFDNAFIEKVEQAIKENPFSHCPGLNYEGNLFIMNIDDRFIDKKYYTVENFGTNREDLKILSDVIIDDLYNKLKNNDIV